jgi:heme/copper-type cytochrome/quinol oxidase subunit 4
MIEHVHTHITSELQQNSRTDTIFILSAILLNLITLAINSGMVEKSRTDNSMLVVMFLFAILIVLVNLVVIFGLQKGKQTRIKLVSGLIRMYKDKEVDKYYDETLLGNYNIRYNLFIMVVTFTGIIAIIVPFVLR